ncbi:MAG: glycogen/starch/alpha-glucan phosphorylase, partial [Clostridia bacterium]|nr:glycogen/starch/alpha-glucan phosphorylase [Clostridia bacterium]
TDDTVKKFIEVKHLKKRRLTEYIACKEGVEIPPEFLVFSQVKRLHEYKRQLMTAFAVLELYYGIKDGSLRELRPCAFVFGAKSAPSYRRAKTIIKFINEIAEKINSDPQTNDRLKVVFVKNYNVSYAEKIVAGTDVSLQVSTAGLEASGTGNMKFMMNGAVTCGTMDGANIEIVERAGLENNYIFGATVNEIADLKKTGYVPVKCIADTVHGRAVESLVDGTFSDGGSGEFKQLYDSLLNDGDPDRYFVLYDLDGYVRTLIRICEDYADETAFARKQLNNVANSAYFSSDRTIKEYAEEIWRIER